MRTGRFMARRIVESLSGVGGVYAGGVLLRTTSYQLSVWTEGAGNDPQSAVSIDGHIDLTGIGETVVLTGPDTLTLRLQDGRRLAFSIATTAGRIIGRGGLQPADV
jgi:hypothetical protein